MALIPHVKGTCSVLMRGKFQQKFWLWVIHILQLVECFNYQLIIAQTHKWRFQQHLGFTSSISLCLIILCKSLTLIKFSNIEDMEAMFNLKMSSKSSRTSERKSKTPWMSLSNRAEWCVCSSITLNVASCRLEATFNRSTWCCLSQVLERVDRKEHQPSCKISASCSDMTHSIHELDIFYSLNHPVLFFQFAKYFSYRHLKSPLSTFKRFRAAILLVYLVTWHRRFYNWNVLREGRSKRNKQKHTYKSVALYSVFHLSSQNTFQLSKQPSKMAARKRWNFDSGDFKWR